MKLLAMLLSAALLIACSGSPNNVRQMMTEVDLGRVSDVPLFIGADRVQTSSQGDTRIFTLHHSRQEIRQLTQNVATVYGFNLVAMEKAHYYLDLAQVVPDSGDCVGGVESVRQGITYSTSVLTLGVVPARTSFCMVVTGMLYYVKDGDQQLLAEFRSNAGQIDVYAGAKDVENYQRIVTRDEELRALESSLAGLFNVMIQEGAFD